MSNDDDDMPALEEAYTTPTEPIMIATYQTKESHDLYRKWLRDYRVVLLVFKHQFPIDEHRFSFDFEQSPLGDTEDVVWFIGIVGRAAGRASVVSSNQ